MTSVIPDPGNPFSFSVSSISFSLLVLHSHPISGLLSPSPPGEKKTIAKCVLSVSGIHSAKDFEQ
jgi:hypothetical protein